MKKSRKKFFSRINFILLSVSFVIILYFIASKPVYEPRLQYSEHTKGSPDAPLSVVVYGDYQCLRTRNFWNQIVPELEKDYINTGKLKLIYKHHPKLFYKYSLEAAEASECAADQGKFWEYHELLIQKSSILCGQVGTGLGLSPPELKAYAKDLGLDTGLFDACLDSGAMVPRIQADIDELHEKGIRASGVVFIDGELMSGNSPYAEFRSRIEKILNQTANQ